LSKSVNETEVIAKLQQLVANTVSSKMWDPLKAYQPNNPAITKINEIAEDISADVFGNATTFAHEIDQ